MHYLIATVSPVFKRMFISSFKEKLTSECVLPTKKYEDIIQMLSFIYPNKNADLSGKQKNLILNS